MNSRLAREEILHHPEPQLSSSDGLRETLQGQHSLSKSSTGHAGAGARCRCPFPFQQGQNWTQSFVTPSSASQILPFRLTMRSAQASCSSSSAHRPYHQLVTCRATETDGKTDPPKSYGKPGWKKNQFLASVTRGKTHIFTG